METELIFATELARDAGKIMRENFGIGMQKEWKADNTPLTVSDTAINKMVIDRVRDSYPTHSILGEEASFPVVGSIYTWVCDPIDGTLPFSTGVPIFAFSLALVKDGVPILGIIYDPILDRMFTATKDAGTFLNNKPIHVSEHATLAQAMIHNDSSKLLSALKSLTEEKAKIARYYTVLPILAP